MTKPANRLQTIPRLLSGAGGIIAHAALLLLCFWGETVFAAPPAPVVTIQRVGNNVVLTWPSGTLQCSTNVLGVYTNVIATSPYTTRAVGAHLFYRVKI
ncbi:MAG: hypothetical protein LAO56_24795 [Acidobacteriia bacterium]|nr:hypothetical protein [Terriglobia bacterium]